LKRQKTTPVLLEGGALTEEQNAGAKQFDPETVEVIYGYLQGVPEAQRNDWKDLDAKIVQIFQAASVVIGLAGFASGNLIGATTAVGVALVAALAFYILALGAACYGLWPRGFLRAQADAVWPMYENGTPTEVRHALLYAVGEAYPENEAVTKKKGRSLVVVFLATGAETVLVAVSLILAAYAGS
jgi:hypothetical protein